MEKKFDTEFTLIKNAQQSGSRVATDRPNITFELDAANDDGGYIYTAGKKRIFDTDELKKAINVEVSELLPNTLETDLDLVQGSLYRDATQSIIDLGEIIASQSVEIADLSARVSELESISASLDIELDSARLRLTIAEESADSIREQLILINESAQQSLQRATLEGIERASLAGRNEGLYAQVQSYKEQVESLTEQLTGKTARLQEGAKAGADITARSTNISNPMHADLTFRGRAKDNGDGRWINGNEIELFNFTVNDVVVSFAQKNVDFLNNIPSITLKPMELRKIKVTSNKSKVNTYKPSAGFNLRADRSYKGTLEIKTNNGTISLTLEVQKQVGARFSGEG